MYNTIDDDKDDDDDYIHVDDACMYVSIYQSIIRQDNRLPVSISTPSYASPSSLLCCLVDVRSEWHLACYIHLEMNKSHRQKANCRL